VADRDKSGFVLFCTAHHIARTKCTLTILDSLFFSCVQQFCGQLGRWKQIQNHLVSRSGKGANPVKNHGQAHNDGDSVPLNGLTCAAGDDRGCVAVRDSQGKNGAFYRSPKKRYEIETNLPTSDEKPSSNDSAQGAWAYIAQKRDVEAFRRWTGWMKEHKELGIWPRYCMDNKCDFNVSDCPMLGRLAVYLGEGNSLCNPNPIQTSSAVAVLQNTFDATVRVIESLPGASLFTAEIDDLKRPITAALNEARVRPLKRSMTSEKR
jgi:hypothetical protein